MKTVAELAQIMMAAPLSTNGWHVALQALATATHSSSGQIIGIGPSRALAFNLVTDPVEADVINRFDTEVADYSSNNWRVAATAAPFEIRHEYHYEEVRRIAKTSVYDEFAHLANIPYGCQTVLHNQNGLLIGLAALRSYDDGPTTQEDRAMFGELAPYVLAAARMQRTLEEDAGRLVAGSLEAMSVAAFLCDSLGTVGATSAAGEAMLLDGGLIMKRDGQLALPRLAEHRALRLIMADMLHGEGAAPGCRSLWLGLDRPVRERRLCEIFALPRREFSFGFEPRLLVTIRMAGDISAKERDAVRTLLGLTAAEAEIAMMIAEGLPRETIAARRGTSTGTVSVQIKRLFEKTGTAREAELVALVRRMLR